MFRGITVVLAFFVMTGFSEFNWPAHESEPNPVVSPSPRPPELPSEVEIVGMRVGDFVLVTFPGELTVEIGLNIKKGSPHKHTFVAGYTNGYIYYTPTAKQLENVGGAQEDSGLFASAGMAAIVRGPRRTDVEEAMSGFAAFLA